MGTREQGGVECPEKERGTSGIEGARFPKAAGTLYVDSLCVCVRCEIVEEKPGEPENRSARGSLGIEWRGI